MLQIILMAKELSNLGFKVTVFNNCGVDAKLAKEGNYNDVTYLDNSILDYKNDFAFDIVISLRTIIPFLAPNQYTHFKEYQPQRYKHIKANAKHKIVWMHDTFANGDLMLEDLLVQGHIDEVVSGQSLTSNIGSLQSITANADVQPSGIQLSSAQGSTQLCSSTVWSNFELDSRST